MPTPFLNEEFTFTNPDGRTLLVRGLDNQHYAVFKTLDGYTVVKDPETVFCKYARLLDVKPSVIERMNFGGTEPFTSVEKSVKSISP
jgi:hypothetical protein